MEKTKMKIIKRLTNIAVGTYIDHKGDLIVITSAYDSYHGWYEYNDTEIDDDGNVVELTTGGYVTPSDLIGDEM